MSTQLQPNEVILKDVRISFAKLFTPEAFKQGDTPTFSAAFLVPKGSEQEKAVGAAVVAALESKWPGKSKIILEQIKGNSNKFCIQNGDAADYDGYAGHIAVRAKNKARPTVIDRDKSPLTEQDGKPYSGCYVNAKLSFFGYDNSGKGVSATLMGVQFVRDGDAFSGSRVASADEFGEDLADQGGESTSGLV